MWILFYDTPVVLDTLGSSDHTVVLLKPSCDAMLDTHENEMLPPPGNNWTYSGGADARRLTANEKTAFASAHSHISWEHMYGHLLPVQVCNEHSSNRNIQRDHWQTSSQK